MESTSGRRVADRLSVQGLRASSGGLQVLTCWLSAGGLHLADVVDCG